MSSETCNYHEAHGRPSLTAEVTSNGLTGCVFCRYDKQVNSIHGSQYVLAVGQNVYLWCVGEEEFLGND